MICDDCETVAYCVEHGCVPKQPTPEDEEFTRVETESKLRQQLIRNITRKVHQVEDSCNGQAQASKDSPDYKMGYADGVAAEREACARVCESAGPDAGPVYCAFAIRARK